MARHRSALLGAALACVLAAAACTGDTRPPSPEVTTVEFEQRLTAHLSRFTTEVLEADARASAPREPVQLSEHNTTESMCRSPKLYVYNREAAPFAGAAPHPMMLVNYRDEESVGYVTLPSSWTPGNLSQPPGSDRTVQLVVCTRIETTRDSGRDATCSYSLSAIPGASGTPYRFDLFESVYHVAVLEARSGRRVSEFSMPGRQSESESCPAAIEEHKPRLARGIDEAAFEGALRPFHTAPR